MNADTIQRVELVPRGLVLEDLERAVARHGLLVGPVGRRQRVVDVADRQSARARAGCPPAPSAARVAGAVELLVVGVGDLGDAGEVRRPRDRREEAPGVGDVALDLRAAPRARGSPADGEEAELLGEEERRLAAAPVAVGAREERARACRRASSGRTVGSFARGDLLEELLELPRALRSAPASSAASVPSAHAAARRARAARGGARASVARPRPRATKSNRSRILPRPVRPRASSP